MKNILEYLEDSARKYPEKIAFSQGCSAMTYDALLCAARSIGTVLLTLGCRNRPVAVVMERGPEALSACFGAVYSGNCYTVIDNHMPQARIEAIFSQLSPAAVIMDEASAEQCGFIHGSGLPVFDYDEIKAEDVTNQKLEMVRRQMIDTDPLYILFTSGSTGMPKGTVVSHRNVMAYMDWLTDAFHFDEHTVFGNQAPFYFSMSVLDIYSTLKHGATMFIIPKQMFSFPIQLLKYMKEHRINTIYWVPSALIIASSLQALDYIELPDLKMVLFAGEVMPVRQLNQWIAHFPDVTFANLYGPTEVTDICSYYVVDRPFEDDEVLPIGNACNNCQLMIIGPDGQEAQVNETGLLYVRGSFVASGYYNAPDKTREVFVQNPLNPHYPEMVYNTGDLVYRRENGEIMYVGRQDFQIKHMGYRIELGEIEAAASAISDISRCVCLYETKQQLLVLICQTGISMEKIRRSLMHKLPQYMIPDKIICTRIIPCNANGKADRAWLKKNFMKGV